MCLIILCRNTGNDDKEKHNRGGETDSQAGRKRDKELKSERTFLADLFWNSFRFAYHNYFVHMFLNELLKTCFEIFGMDL